VVDYDVVVIGVCRCCIVECEGCLLVFGDL